MISYFLNLKIFKIIDNTKYMIIIYVLCLLSAPLLNSLFLSNLPLAMMSDKYATNAESTLEFELSSGYGNIAISAINILIFASSNRVKKIFRDTRIIFMYRAFFIGCCLSTFMWFSIFLSRIPLGLTSLKIYLLAFYLFYLLKYKSLFNNIIRYALIILFILFFIMGIYNSDNMCSPYSFRWL